MAMKKPTQLELFGQELPRNAPVEKRLSSEARAELIALYQEGWTIPSLEEKFGICRYSVYSLFRRIGSVKLRGHRKILTPEIEDAIRSRYESEGPKRIAHDFGASSQLVIYWANQMGIKSLNRCNFISETRTKGNRSVNYRFFDEWSVPMAYALGYIWADGSIQTRNWSLSLRCTSADDAIIRSIATSMGAKRKFSHYPARFHNGLQRNIKPTTAIQISSRILIKSLMERHGVLPNKSRKDLPFPVVPQDFLSHFVRGYFDGDGWVTKAKRQRCPIVGFCGSFQFVSGMADRISSELAIRRPTLHPAKSIYRITWSARQDVKSLFSWMYPPGDYTFLVRKKEAMAACLGC